MVWPSSAGDCCLSGLWASDCGLPLPRWIHARVWFVACLLSFGSGGRRHLSTLDAFVHRPEIFFGQSWPLLDFNCCGFSAGLCRSCLSSPSRCLSEYALSCHQLVSPRCVVSS